MLAVYEAGTFHQELDMSMSAAGQSLSISAEADVDNENQKIGMTMDLGMLGGEMQMVMDDGVVYMRSPVFENAGTEWVSMDPSKMDPAAAAQFGGFGAGTTDPSAFVGLFAGVFDVKASGEQELEGRAHHPLRRHDRPEEGARGVLGRGGQGRRRGHEEAARGGPGAVHVARDRREDPVRDLDRRGGAATPATHHDGLR